MTAAPREEVWLVRDASAWIGLAATPVFALMALIAATSAPAIAICTSASVIPGSDGMIWMYLLMTLFHVSPWLRLLFGERHFPPTLAN